MNSTEQARRFAAELRRIIEKLVVVDAPADELALAADAAKGFADRLEEEFPKRRSWYEVAETAVADMVVDGSTESRAERGFFDRSPIVGLSNPLAPPLSLEIAEADGQRFVIGRASYTAAYEGPPGNVHGGMVAAAWDEVLGMAQSLSGQAGFTGTLTIRYRSPTPLFENLEFRAQVDRVEGRKIFTSGTCHAGDRLTSEAEAIFITVDRAKFEQLMREREAREKATG
ncbi:MAG TPA: PaaI family thioesterase [Actinomycetota bacterium]|nr:PaaI family thioesterase [Actinomycetota bacterium]